MITCCKKQSSVISYFFVIMKYLDYYLDKYLKCPNIHIDGKNTQGNGIKKEQ